MQTPTQRCCFRAGLAIAGGVATLLGIGILGYLRHNVTGLRKGMEGVRAAGFVEKQITVNGHSLNYAEGPANGKPLVLIHGQASQWRDHMLVLPELAANHHIFAVDVPGHGHSARLAPEQYTNANVGDLLATFIDQVTDAPVLLSGHSSGGLLALRISSEHPELVAGLVLEDPPLFSSELPRLRETTGGITLVLAEKYLAAGEPEGGFQRYFAQHGNYFAFFGPLEERIKRYALNWIDEHPGEPLHIFYLPPLVNVFFEGLVNYDPAFGAAWVTEEHGWYAGFDTDAALRAVSVPTTLIHTNYMENKHGTAYRDGVLMAAMDSVDANRALDLLPDDTELVQLQSGHLVHFERPQEFIATLHALTTRLNRWTADRRLP